MLGGAFCLGRWLNMRYGLGLIWSGDGLGELNMGIGRNAYAEASTSDFFCSGTRKWDEFLVR